MGAEAEDINTEKSGVSRDSPADLGQAEHLVLDGSAHLITSEFVGGVKSSPKIWALLTAKSPSYSDAVDIQKLLFQLPTKAQLRQLSSIQHVIIHSTSIDPVGDYSSSDLEILDDRIKLDSLAAVLVSLLSKAQGAPLRALCRSLKLKQEVLVHSVLNVSEPNSHSIAGEVSGAEVTVGDEEFLLERGVLLDSLADTLLEPGQEGFYLLIAVGDAMVARVLITPPRKGDGRALSAYFQQQQTPVQIFTLGAASPDTSVFAADAGISQEQIYAIDSTLHLDSFLEKRKPFVLITTDPDCARYVGIHGSVALLSEREIGVNGEHVLEFSSFDLRSVTYVHAHARRQTRREKLVMSISAFAALLVVVFLALVFS